MKWCVVDMFGFAWGDLVDSLEEAKRQLKDIQEDSNRRGWDIEFEIEKKGIKFPFYFRCYTSKIYS